MLKSLRFLPQGRRIGAVQPALDKEQPRAPRTTTVRVGVWDLEVYAGYLPDVLTSWNDHQAVFLFEMVDAAVPRAVSKGGESTIAWARDYLPKSRIAQDRSDLLNNVVAEHLYGIADRARQAFGLDLLVLMTPEMIAFAENGAAFYNYCSWSRGKVVIVSAADVRDFAKRARRRFEIALASMILAQVLAAVDRRVGFHEETRGCIFDFNEERSTLVRSFRRLQIEPSCLATISPQYREAAHTMVNILLQESA